MVKTNKEFRLQAQTKRRLDKTSNAYVPFGIIAYSFTYYVNQLNRLMCSDLRMATVDL